MRIELSNSDFPPNALQVSAETQIQKKKSLSERERIPRVEFELAYRTLAITPHFLLERFLYISFYQYQIMSLPYLVIPLYHIFM